MTQWIVTLCEQDAIVKLKEAGADELLVSVPFFSLRAARVFSCDQLAELSAKIHDAGMRIAVNCTRFFMEDELEQLRSFLRLLKEIPFISRMRACCMRPSSWGCRIVSSISRTR